MSLMSSLVRRTNSIKINLYREKPVKGRTLFAKKERIIKELQNPSWRGRKSTTKSMLNPS